MDPDSLQKLNEPIVALYTFLNPATAAALNNFVPAKTSFLIFGGSTGLSLFLFILDFPLFHRQARALCCAPRRFFKNKSSQIFHVTDVIDSDTDSSILMTPEEITGLHALGTEALLKTEANAPLFPPKVKQNCTRTLQHKPAASVQHLLHWFWLPSLQLRYLTSTPYKPRQSK